MANISIETQIKELISYLLNQESGHTPENLYKLIIEATEKPMIQAILKHTNGNQTVASQLLGISRITLRKKLKQLNIEK
jgi:Fis family transcriptional regulator